MLVANISEMHHRHVASFLLSLADRNNGHGETGPEIVRPMAPAHMADFLGMRVEAISRCLGRFEWMGLIESPQPCRMVLRDRAALERLAGGM